MLVLGLCCDDGALCHAVAHCIETRHPSAMTAPSVPVWLYELRPVVGSTPELVVVLNIADSANAAALRSTGAVVLHLTRGCGLAPVDVVEGDYLLTCRDGDACYDRIRDTLHAIEQEARECG